MKDGDDKVADAVLDFMHGDPRTGAGQAGGPADQTPVQPIAWREQMEARLADLELRVQRLEQQK